jgi:hypothetical protein
MVAAIPPLLCATTSTCAAPVRSRITASASATTSACWNTSPCGCANVSAYTGRNSRSRCVAMVMKPRLALSPAPHTYNTGVPVAALSDRPWCSRKVDDGGVSVPNAVAMNGE